MKTFRLVAPEDYLTHDCLSGGDYGGFGYIAHVNVRELENIAATDPDVRDNVASCGMNCWSLAETVEFHKECPPALIIAEGGYNSITAYVHPDWEEGREVIEGLENYPVISDEALSEREIELENECWDSYLRHDIQSDILKGVTDSNIADLIEELLESGEFDLRDLFLDCCESANVYPEYEGGGSVYYSGIEEVVSTMRDFLLIEVDDRPEAAHYRAVRDGLIAPLGLDA